MRDPLYFLPNILRRSGAASRLCPSLFSAVFLILLILPGESPFAREPIFLYADSSGHGRSASKAAAYQPWVDYRLHDNGYLWTTVHNNGVIGNVFRLEMPYESKQAPTFYYPRMSRKQHGYYTALWVGGVLNGDTLVSTAIESDWGGYGYIPPMEFWPNEYPEGAITTTSDDPLSDYYSPDAKAELQHTSTYTDTTESGWWTPYNNYDSRSHKPLGLSVTQTTYSWSYKYIRDVIIVDYQIKNVGNDTIHDAFVGLYYAACNLFKSEQMFPPADDVVGYIRDWPHEFEELGDEVLNVAWCLDADGWSHSFGWNLINTANAFAIAPLRVPKGSSRYNFNWWGNDYGTYYNWGPRTRGTANWPLRLFEGGLGAPRSDRDKYYLMSKPEVDYGGYMAALDYSRVGWLPPHEYADDIADGHLPRVVVSYGPSTIPPDGAVDFSVALVIGKDVHYDRGAFRELFDPMYPERFTGQLDFDDLITNVRWARLTFDNPGVDTNLDGDSGKYFDRYDPEIDDTVRIYYEGDGVPDLNGAEPPPTPELRIIPDNGKITLRWNGRLSERCFDPFSRAHDFEGYRVYISRSEIADEPTLLTSYDHHNFNRYTWDRRLDRYTLTELPFTLDSLQTLYGEDIEPLEYRYGNPLEANGNIYYFEKVDYNASELGAPHGIRKLYPDALNDTSDVDEEGRMRYYEYEFVIDNLLPTLPYFVTVTAFDFGHPPKSLEPMESSPYNNMVEVMAVKQGEDVLDNGQLNVYVYPNPYRLDSEYLNRGLENRAGQFAPSRSATVYFANLPNKCTITIYSLDGDRIRTLYHDEPAGSSTASTHRWNLITRNTMWVVSGLYYWVVESEYGSQIGKLVILK